MAVNLDELPMHLTNELRLSFGSLVNVPGDSSGRSIAAGRAEKTAAPAVRGAAFVTRGGAAALVVLRSAGDDRKRPPAALATTTPVATDPWVTLPNLAGPLLRNLSIPADAPRHGMWSRTVGWPLDAIHAAQWPDGRVLAFGTRRLFGARSTPNPGARRLGSTAQAKPWCCPRESPAALPHLERRQAGANGSAGLTEGSEVAGGQIRPRSNLTLSLD